MYLVVFHLDSGWKFSEFNIKKEVFKWPNLILNVCGCWFICRIASDASNVRSCKARPRWGNERTWSGIERTLHCTINITDHLLHIKHFKKIVTGWEKFEGFQDFLRMLVFVSILQAQKCKNYGKPLDSGVCGLAKLLPPCIVRQEWIYIVHYTSHNIHMCVLSTTGGNCTISACCTTWWGNIAQYVCILFTTLCNIAPPEATNELEVQTWTGSGQSYFWKIAPSSSSQHLYSLKIKIRDFFFGAASLKIKTKNCLPQDWLLVGNPEVGNSWLHLCKLQTRMHQHYLWEIIGE